MKQLWCELFHHWRWKFWRRHAPHEACNHWQTVKWCPICREDRAPKQLIVAYRQEQER